MKRLSHRDFIIALGILVAAVIILTTVYFSDVKGENKSVKIAPDKKIKPAVILKTVVQKFSVRAPY